MKAQALWIVAAGRTELRPETLPATGALVETLFTGISRGTEALVFKGRVPETEWTRMRAPLQSGDFPFPIKYGYSAVGRADDGRIVFCLHPHQDRFRVPDSMLVPVPEVVPPGRAILAANMETALNIVWDGGAGPGDRVAVVGAGVVGALTGWLCARIPGTEVTLIDVNPARAGLARVLGCGFATPPQAPGECDLVIHTSATASGLATALSCAGDEATVVEASWYGDRPAEIALGGAFHSRRLRLVSSQVGAVSGCRRPRWSHRRRLAKALSLLTDPRLDALISGETVFDEIASRYGSILDDADTLCHRISYP